MPHCLTRVLKVVYEGDPDPKKPWSNERTRLDAIVLYLPEVKRQLGSLEAAATRAVDLARRLIGRDLVRHLNLESLRCSVEVVEFDLRPFEEQPHWQLEDGTRVWLTEVQ
jgi:hypothetical protein